MDRTVNVLGGIAIGAGLIYLLDPTRGRRRRALIRDKGTRLLHTAESAAGKVARDAKNRAAGIAAEARKVVQRRDEPPDDDVLTARVRSQIGRCVSHPRAVEVTVHEGSVTLTGPVLSDEANRLISDVKGVRGVREVHDQLERHETPDNVPALQGGRERLERYEWMQSNWSPSIRAAAGLTGAGLLVYACSQRNVFGWACGLVGAGCLTRSITNREFNQLLPSSETFSTIPDRASHMANRMGETVSDLAGRARTRVADLTQRGRKAEEAGAFQTP